jgi:hypothetical protein
MKEPTSLSVSLEASFKLQVSSFKFQVSSLRLKKAKHSAAYGRNQSTWERAKAILTGMHRMNRITELKNPVHPVYPCQKGFCRLYRMKFLLKKQDPTGL